MSGWSDFRSADGAVIVSWLRTRSLVVDRIIIAAPEHALPPRRARRAAVTSGGGNESG